MATVALLGTLDTKGFEYAFLKDRVEAAGCKVITINAGILGDPDYAVDYARQDVAGAAGGDLEAMIETDDRGAAVTTMARGAAALVEQLHSEGRIHGVLGAGGSGGSSIISHAMRSLPVGFPKLLVSTMGAGDVSPYVGSSDIAVMYSVVDIAGINAISSQILGNAAAAICAMAEAFEGHVPDRAGKPLIGATMYGATTPCVDSAREWLEAAGYEVLVFHATGTGGRSMEALMRSGHITASLDITTTELIDEIAGGTMNAGPDRLETAGKMGLPQVVAPGAVDVIAFTPPEAVPEEYRHRNLYSHNPSVTLVRSSPEENTKLGEEMARRLNRAIGPLTVFIPSRGTSEYSRPGAVFHDVEADAALFSSLRMNLDPAIEVIEIDAHINDPEFGLAMATKLDEHYRTWARSRRRGEDDAAGREAVGSGTPRG